VADATLGKQATFRTWNNGTASLFLMAAKALSIPASSIPSSDHNDIRNAEDRIDGRHINYRQAADVLHQAVPLS
jgi:hypothetical protein